MIRGVALLTALAFSLVPVAWATPLPDALRALTTTERPKRGGLEEAMSVAIPEAEQTETFLAQGGTFKDWWARFVAARGEDESVRLMRADYVGALDEPARWTFFDFPFPGLAGYHRQVAIEFGDAPLAVLDRELAQQYGRFLVEQGLSPEPTLENPTPVIRWVFESMPLINPDPLMRPWAILRTYQRNLNRDKEVPTAMVRSSIRKLALIQELAYRWDLGPKRRSSLALQAGAEGARTFGPVQPADELRSRLDGGFRLQYIAAKSLLHGSSSTSDLQELLAGLRSDIEMLANDLTDFLDLREDEVRARAAMTVFDELDGENGQAWAARSVGYSRPSSFSVERWLDSLVYRVEVLRGAFDLHDTRGQQIDAAVAQLSSTARARRALPRIQRGIRDAGAFLEDRRALARGENVEAAVASWVDIQDGVLDTVRRYGSYGSLRIETAALQADTQVAMSPVRLFALVNNLLVDAFKHGQGGEIVLRLETVADTGALKITVSDAGQGIPGELFDPSANGRVIRLFALEQRGDRVPPGMAEVWDTVAVSGGELTVTSTLGQGTTFTVTLPPTQALEAATWRLKALVDELPMGGPVLVLDPAALEQDGVPERHRDLLGLAGLSARVILLTDEMRKDMWTLLDAIRDLSPRPTKAVFVGGAKGFLEFHDQASRAGFPIEVVGRVPRLSP